MDDKLLSYVKKSINESKSLETIKSELINAGWDNQKVEETISLARSSEEQSQNTVDNNNLPPEETTKTKLVALWLILLAVILIIGGAFSIISSYQILTIGLSDYISMLIIFSSLSIGIKGIIAAFLGTSLFKVSSGIHKLEIESYTFSYIFFIVQVVLSGLNVLTSVINLNTTSIMFAIMGIVINGLFILILRSEKARFTNSSGKSLKTRMSILFGALILFSLLSAIGDIIK